ncbi:AcrR family transcriptional regulator [Saccharomonospora amisosensis]|uniref:AcrR family transcriptional regulator n=1 Tax=Saccharomonospora amisosensis TaxID=1128677 RepID=A0A7X5ZPV4_9PSEU|nr:TetR family transcriptional regulator [Saccharomonospora amisosensis]NIJ11168.1 AcrR family transcriptional regulator [Saccharomonospora amisosensis]
MSVSETDQLTKGEGRPQRQRRRSSEVDALILDAAQQLFGSKGYAGTSGREIAKLANVHEPSIYRRFGSKAGLFEAAVLSPFNEAISSYLEEWQKQVDEPATTVGLVRSFVTPMYALVSEHRELVLALLAAHEFHAGSVDAERPNFDALLRRMDTQAQVESMRRGLQTSEDAKLTVRVATAMVMGMALLSDWLLPPGAARPSDEVITDEMVRLISHGVAAQDAAPAGSARGEDSAMSPFLLNQLLDRLAEAEGRAVRAELELERLRAATRSAH